MWSASPIHLSTEQNTAFVSSYSNVRVVCSIAWFDSERLSYTLYSPFKLQQASYNMAPRGLADLFAHKHFDSRPQVIYQPAPSTLAFDYIV